MASKMTSHEVKLVSDLSPRGRAPGNKGRIAQLVLFAALPLMVFGGYLMLFNASTNAEPTTATYRLQGMTCQSCATGIEGTLSVEKDIKSVSVSFEKKQATVVWKGAADHRRLIKLLKDIGYDAQVIK